jgi:hypothetical protein
MRRLIASKRAEARYNELLSPPADRHRHCKTI